MFVWENPDWPHWRYDASALATALASVRHSQGRLLGEWKGWASPYAIRQHCKC